MGYSLFLAKIVGDVTNEDSRLQVRITPNMDAIPDEMCPRYPYFFQDEALTGSYGDLVWCVCDEEFSSGYVMGLANYNTYSEESGTFKDYSIPTDLKENASQALLNLKAAELNFNNVKVSHWDQNSIHFIERKTGGSIIAFKSGTLYIMRPTEFIIRIANSSIKLDASGISFKGNALKLQSKDVELGDNPSGNLLVTNGVTGQNSMTSKYVRA